MQPKKKIDLKKVDARATQKLLADLSSAPKGDAAAPTAKWPAPFRAAGGKHAAG